MGSQSIEGVECTPARAAAFQGTCVDGDTERNTPK